MKHAVRRFSLAAMCFSSPVLLAQQAASDQLLAAIQSLPAWKTFNWTEAASSPLWKDRHWKKVVPATEDEDGTTHTRVLQYMSLSWKARLIEPPNRPGDYGFSMSTDVPQDQCLAIANTFGKSLGAPAFSDESMAAYFSDTAYTKLVYQRFQWLNGTTIIDGLCVGTQTPSASTDIGSESKAFTLGISFKPARTASVLKPSFLLRCSRKSVMILGRPGEKTLADLVVRVVPDSKQIKNTRFETLSADGTVNIDEISISFVIRNENGEFRHFIDRTTGSFTAELKKGEENIAKLSGTCERVESAQKF